jgi:hypothetical protein
MFGRGIVPKAGDFQKAEKPERETFKQHQSWTEEGRTTSRRKRQERERNATVCSWKTTFKRLRIEEKQTPMNVNKTG